MDLQAGTEIGQFVLDRQLGIGCLGEVWLAYQPSMERSVALKMLSYELFSDNTLTERFLNEAKVLGRLQHANILPVFEVGKDKGFYYLAGKYIHGANLEDKLDTETTFKEKYALTIINIIANALKYAWDSFHITHRDIKPANIMEDCDGSISLMDLGISKDFEDNPYVPKSGIVIGTPYYMSPEQARSEDDIDFKADIYSLGGVLFHFVTGQFPFNANSPVGILTRHITDPLPDPRGINKAISPGCSKLIKWMMEKSPAKRPESLDALIDALKRVQNGLSPKQKTLPSPEIEKIKYVPLDNAKQVAEAKNNKQVKLPSLNNNSHRFVDQIVEKKQHIPTQVPLQKKNYQKGFSDIIDKPGILDPKK
jgi:serine/threonine protein kinase